MKKLTGIVLSLAVILCGGLFGLLSNSKVALRVNAVTDSLGPISIMYYDTNLISSTAQEEVVSKDGFVGFNQYGTKLSNETYANCFGAIEGTSGTFFVNSTADIIPNSDGRLFRVEYLTSLDSATQRPEVQFAAKRVLRDAALSALNVAVLAYGAAADAYHTVDIDYQHELLENPSAPEPAELAGLKATMDAKKILKDDAETALGNTPLKIRQATVISPTSRSFTAKLEFDEMGVYFLTIRTSGDVDTTFAMVVKRAATSFKSEFIQSTRFGSDKTFINVLSNLFGADDEIIIEPRFASGYNGTGIAASVEFKTGATLFCAVGDDKDTLKATEFLEYKGYVSKAESETGNPQISIGRKVVNGKPVPIKNGTYTITIQVQYKAFDNVQANGTAYSAPTDAKTTTSITATIIFGDSPKGPMPAFLVILICIGALGGLAGVWWLSSQFINMGQSHDIRKKREREDRARIAREANLQKMRTSPSQYAPSGSPTDDAPQN
ncbi:MAG: hypothetical protein LBG88_04565 [Christensenellaceae bacterium]|nr:hypothetical protein [Christensenellaceae bacterium]